MNTTENLNLPQYTEEDIFDLQDINKAYDSIDKAYSNIDNAYKEVIDIKDEITKTNATAEVINARGGKETLGKRLDEFGSQLDTKANENEVRKKSVELNLNDFDEASRSAITGGDYNLNYVLGERNVKSKNIDYLNVNLNHLSEKCFNEGELPSISKKVIGFDISQKSQAGWLNGTAMGCYFKFPMTMFTKGETVRFEYEVEDTNNCFSNVGHWILYGNSTAPVEIETRVQGTKTSKYTGTFTIKDTLQSYIYINVYLTNIPKDWYNYSILFI